MNTLLLDTHIYIWYLIGSKELKPVLRNKITQAFHDHTAYLAAISLWEIAMLDAKKRIIFEMPCLEWINRSLELTRINIVSLTPSIVVDSCHLAGGFHDDPADRMIVATARVENLTLVTKDKRIIKYSKDKHVTVIAA